MTGQDFREDGSGVGEVFRELKIMHRELLRCDCQEKIMFIKGREKKEYYGVGKSDDLKVERIIVRSTWF